MQFLTALLGGVALLTPVIAQTFTDCNPMNKTCPNDPAFGLNHNFVFNSSRTVTDSFNITSGALSYGTNGAEFTIAKQKDSPTIQSHFYIFFGSVSVIMRAASGQGIISSIVLESDDLDEVDWEFMGGNGTHAETNYFGKGNQTTFDRAIYYPVDSDVRDNFHNYTVDWTAEKIDWYIDSKIVRTLLFAEANSGNNYPQTPMTVRLGIWAGGDVDNNNKGTVEWAGGATDFSKAPWTMFVKSANVADYSSGKEYQWTDKSGTWQSIKAIQGTSTANETIVATENEKPSLSLSQKFAALPQTTKIAIYASAAGAGALLFALLMFTCIRQRRAGRKERDAYNAKVEKEREEAYRDQMELREKGLGGWDKNAYSTQGEDALGGWGGSHVAHGEKGSALEAVPPMPKIPSNVMVSEVPSRSNTPGTTRSMSPAIVSPVPQSPRQPQWAGGNPGGMIANAGNAYSGGYGGNTNAPNVYSGGNNYSGGYANTNNIPRSPSFPLSPQVPQQRGYQQGGYSSGGYQRF